MRDLAGVEGVRNDTGDLAASREHRIGKDAHQADVSASVDERQPACHERTAQVPRGGRVGRVRTHR